MPELPEVQTTVDGLNEKVVGRRITGFWSDYGKLIKKPNLKDFGKIISGLVINEVKRKGKNILISLSDNYILLIHQKMTGHLMVGKWEIGRKGAVSIEPAAAVSDPYNRFIHLILYLDNKEMVALSDARKFSKIVLGTKEEIENLPELKKMGPEPLGSDFTFKKFEQIIKLEKRKIKQVLMDPEAVAGIGNIYSDEMLWKARIHPFTPANKLSESELRELYKAMIFILNKALKLRGTSVSDYRDVAGEKGGYGDVRYVYGKEGELCPVCGGKIKRIKMGGRSAHYCPHCQKQ